MLDVDTFLTALYVIVDDFCQSHRSKSKRLGPKASLSESEVLTLATFVRFSRFTSERDFYSYAKSNPRGAFPTLCPTVRSSTAACAFPGGTHRRSGLAPGADDGGPEEVFL